MNCRVLLIDDDPVCASFVSKMLSEAEKGISIEQVERLADAMEKIYHGGADVIILDLDIHDGSGLETLDYVLDKTSDIPVVVITDVSDEIFGMEAVRRGAQDYLAREDIEPRILKRSLSYAIERKKLEVALKRVNELCARQATTDALTGIYNRLKFNELLDAEIQRSRRYKTPLSIIMFDIDHFKRINDKFGHNVGDKVLIDVSRLVSENIRGQDIFARWGGEEFMIVVPNTGMESAYVLAEKLRGLMEACNGPDKALFTASFGVTEFSGDEEADELTRRVDEAMYAAKRSGRNKAVAF